MASRFLIFIKIDGLNSLHQKNNNESSIEFFKAEKNPYFHHLVKGTLICPIVSFWGCIYFF